MKQLFNTTSIKFISGFVGMVMLGLAGILIASYFEGNGDTPADAQANVVSEG